MPKYDFSNIAALAPTSEATVDYSFILRDGTVLATVKVAAADDDNLDFFNERVRINIAESQAPARPDTGLSVWTVDELKEQRDANCALIAAACVKGWVKAPIDANGKPAPFNVDAVREFLLALPRFQIDPFITFCKNVQNFVPSPTKPVAAAIEEMGNGSPPKSATS